MRWSKIALVAFGPVDAVNKWSVASYDDQPNGPVEVPLNNWGGNSPENVHFEPRAEKRPDDVRYFGKPWGSFSFDVPGTEEDTNPEHVAWHQDYRKEGNENEMLTDELDADGNKRYTRKVHQFNTDYWEFAQTETEKEAGWLRESNRCGRKDGPAQQDDTNCPNIIVINTDDLAWADISINNPSKVVPTPNLDRLVSKGINFRDGHSCTSRCAPSRYCMMSGRHHWRRGDYHYKPMYLEQGRKIMPQMFKRAGYRTYLLGKAQPTDSVSLEIQTVDHYTECRAETGDGWSSTGGGEGRRVTVDKNKEWYNGGAYVAEKHDYMYMEKGENGLPMDPIIQKVCWLGADATVHQVCKDADQCHSLKISTNVVKYEQCVDECLTEPFNQQRLQDFQAYEQAYCPSRKRLNAFCTQANTNYKNFFLEQGVTKWGFDTGFNSFSYCCSVGAAFFRDDYNVEALRSYGVYADIRTDDHMYNDNRRIRDDWMSKNAQYMIGRTGLFKAYQGDKFRPWSAQYDAEDRYTNLQIDGTTGRPCAHLNDDTKCKNPVDVGQCDFMEALQSGLETASTELVMEDYIKSDLFEETVQLLESSYFLMHQNETKYLMSFQRIQRINMIQSEQIHGRKRRQIDDAQVLGPFPDHDGGHFKKISPTLTASFFRDYISRSGNVDSGTELQKQARIERVIEFVSDLVQSITMKVNHILEHEISCTSRDRRETPAIKRVVQSTESTMSTSPNTALKLLVRGSIKTLGRKLVRPNMNKTETLMLRENYEFSANMYKFIYSENEQNADNYIHSGEDKPRHFYTLSEAKKFVDDVSDAFLQYQGIAPTGARAPTGHKREYTDDQRNLFKLWQFTHTKKKGQWVFNAPRAQPSFDSREVLKNFNEESIKYFVEAKHHVAKTNQPFFMYCAYRAPHRPFSHTEEYDYVRPGGFIGKPGEQLREFDDRIGLMLKTLEDLNLADNTFIVFTSDNGPDGGAFQNQDFAGHVRFGTFRGKKASIYEGGHRVPFLVWWPKGISKSLWGSNYDLPVSQQDLFATFAQMINYPLPKGDKCTYAFDEQADPIQSNSYSRSMSHIRREADKFHHSHTFSAIKSGYLSNDEHAKWTVDTLRKTCNRIEGCMCDNWTNENNPEYNATVARNCLSNQQIYKTLEHCQCKPIEVDCPTGYCFSSIEISKFDWQMVTGGRDLLNSVFYNTTEDGKMTSVGAWDSMSLSDQIKYRNDLDKIGSYNQFLTVEHKTGLVLGFDGCMAEDSHSFANAFKRSDSEKNTGKWHRRPAQINAGKLGDLSIRMGRYKLVRFNPPKDRRTGPNAQQLRPHDQSEWPSDGVTKNGVVAPDDWLNQDQYTKCSWAPAYTEGMKNEYESNLVMFSKNGGKNSTANQRHMCQRDFYYELWDLHINPGEKNLCSKKYSTDAWEAMLEPGNYQSPDNPRENDWIAPRQGLGGNVNVNDLSYGLNLQPGKPEKFPDPAGIGPGKESTPVPAYVNDCCLMDYGDYVSKCENTEDDACENPKNPDKIKESWEILQINHQKVEKKLAADPELFRKLFTSFPEDFKDSWAIRNSAARAMYWRQKLDAVDTAQDADRPLQVDNAGRRVGRNIQELPILVHKTTGEDCITLHHVTYVKEIKKGKIVIREDIVDPRIAAMTIIEDYENCVESEANFRKDVNGAYHWEIPENKRVKNLMPKNSHPSWKIIWGLASDKNTSTEVISSMEQFLDQKHRKPNKKNMDLSPEEKKTAVVNLFVQKTKFTNGEITNSYDPSTYCPSKGSPNVIPCRREQKRRRRDLSRRLSRTMGSRAIKSYQVTNFQYGFKAVHYQFLMDQFAPSMSGFAQWASTHYKSGYRCKTSPMLSPKAYLNHDNEDITKRFCQPPPEPSACKVATHQGPVGNGFHIKPRATDADRGNGYVTKEMEVKGFKKYTKFAQCMLDVLREIEGIAHQPELDEELKRNAGGEDYAKWRDQTKDENYNLSGFRNGLGPRSLYSKASNVRALPLNHNYMASEPIGTDSMYLHGSGSRFVQPNNDDYYQACKKYLVAAGLPDAYEVPPSTVPGTPNKAHLINSILNTDNLGNGPGALDYDMDGSLLSYSPLKKAKRLDGKCVMIPKWLPDREADFIKYDIVNC